MDLESNLGGSSRSELMLLPLSAADMRDEVTLHETSAHDAIDIGRVGPPSLPLVLQFSSLTYSVKFHRNFNFLKTTPNKTKTILRDISGVARDGEIMALLGASGSGKSTLIDALANRIDKRTLKGKVTLNGESIHESRLFKAISAYVMQDDLLFPMLTVEETLMFAAEFRLPRSLSKSKKKARVQQLIDQLGLQNSAKTIIGDEGHRGVSGGEKRRVSIGIDIIHDPIILFLDEPTSGLDSTSAYMVVKVLQKIAQTGSIVIMSIHQPSSRLMGLFDKLLIMSQGQALFSGVPSELLGFFSEFKCRMPENGESTVEFALDLIRELECSPDGNKELLEFNKLWQSKRRGFGEASEDTTGYRLSLLQVVRASIYKGKLVSCATTDPETTSVSMIQTFANPFWVEIVTLSKRSMINSSRQPEVFGIRLGSAIVTAFILATVFWKLDNSPRGVQERLGFFAYAMSSLFYTCADAMIIFIQQKFIFMRETAYNAYRRSSYVFSTALTALPSLIVLSFAFASCTFWAVGLAGGFMGFLYYFALIFASFWAGNSFVSFLSSIVPQTIVAYISVVAILAYFLLFSGFFITRDRIPAYWLWFHYISLVKYPYMGVMLNEFSDPTRCFVRGDQIFDNTPLGVVSYNTKLKLLQTLGEALGMTLTPSTCVTTSFDVLRYQEVNELSIWACFWITVSWGVFYRILFYLSLLVGNKNKRK